MTTIFKVNNLKKYFPVRGGIFLKTIGWIHAVDNVSFSIEKGEILGIVGESGSGKTSLIQTMIRLHEPTSGEVYYDKNNVFDMTKHELRDFRRNVQIVFQDPFSSLDPRQIIHDIVAEPLLVHGLEKKGEKLTERVLTLLREVELDQEHLGRFPHELSGGQRQRVAITRVLSLEPKVLFLDEPTSAIDVSVQVQILKLLEDLHRSYDLTYVIVSHDLKIIRYMCNRIAVMYLGHIVEIGGNNEVFYNPQHPYSKSLLSSSFLIHEEYTDKYPILEGEIPSPRNPPSGCRFHTRCPVAFDRCSKEEPKFWSISPTHFSKCHLAESEGVSAGVQSYLNS